MFVLVLLQNGQTAALLTYNDGYLNATRDYRAAAKLDWIHAHAALAIVSERGMTARVEPASKWEHVRG